jgi:hypothetical protein
VAGEPERHRGLRHDRSGDRRGSLRRRDRHRSWVLQGGSRHPGEGAHPRRGRRGRAGRRRRTRGGIGAQDPVHADEPHGPRDHVPRRERDEHHAAPRRSRHGGKVRWGTLHGVGLAPCRGLSDARRGSSAA